MEDLHQRNLVLIDSNVLKLVFLKQFPLGTEYRTVMAHVAKASQILNIRKVCFDEGGAGEPVVEELRRIGANVEGLFFTERVKEQLLSNLKLKKEQRRIALPQYQPLISQISEQ